MFQNSRPVFAGGVVLKAKMLDSVSKYPRELFDILYNRHSNGIITGAQISIQNKTTICVSKGIIKFNGMLYYMAEDEYIEASPKMDTQYLRVRFKVKETLTDEEKLETEFILDTEITNQENEIELCRFVLNAGAILRAEYTDLRDYATTHNTINMLETKYAAIDTPTFNPAFLLEFGRVMNGYKLTNADDIVFTTECIKEENIKREIIERYISKRLGENLKSYSNQEIYRKLIDICDIAKRGETVGGMQGRMQTRRMIVD